VYVTLRGPRAAQFARLGIPGLLLALTNWGMFAALARVRAGARRSPATHVRPACCR
jgi:hypothetical protein